MENFKQEYEKWQDLARLEKKHSRVNETQFSKETPEQISLQNLYTSQDLIKRGYQESLPGLAAFERGPYASMYTSKPWTIRQYAGFSTAEESNLFYKKNLKAGQKGLSVAFDLPTHRGYDSDHPRALGDVGKAGVAVDSVLDMEVLFADIPLDQISVSMTMNGAVLPILAAFIVNAKRNGVAPEKIRGTIQNDILKEYLVRNTYIYPPEPSLRIVADVISYTCKNLPNFNSISISGYHLQEAGADSALELAFTIADGMEYTKAAVARGLDIDAFAPGLSFFFAIGMNFFMEIAKLRAARRLWGEFMAQYKPKNHKSLLLRTHCQTSGYSLSAKAPYNNVVRTTIEAMAACLGGTQSLHTNALDEALALPSEFSAKIARDTQLIIQEETDLTHTIDPFGGSYFMESLTIDLYNSAKKIISEIEELGGMARAIVSGYAKSRIETASAIKQSRLDRGQDVVVGVNKYVKAEDEQKIDLLTVDNKAVLEKQKARLAQLRSMRDPKKVAQSLSDLRKIAQDGEGNLLHYSILAMENLASVGEVSLALEEVFGRYQKDQGAVQGVYLRGYEEVESFKKLQTRVDEVALKLGRRPRILVAKLGQDGHDRGAKVIAAGLSDLGFDVDMGALFLTPYEVAKQAMENDVHFIGVSTQAGAHVSLVPELFNELKKLGANDVMVVVGGVIPPNDYENLLASGVLAIFPPATKITESAGKLLDLLDARYG